jgi:iron complex transport system substrate-binding protein
MAGEYGLSIDRFLRGVSAALLACALGTLARPARAATYPMTVTDEAGRQVTITAEPHRLALQDGRDISALALLDRDNPFQRLVIWNNMVSRVDPVFWAALQKQWPAANSAVDMGFNDNGQVDAERLLAAEPQLVIAQRRAQTPLTDSGVMRQLDALHIPILFIDSFDDPVNGVEQSVTLLGKVLGREKEAQDYVDYYEAHVRQLQDGIAAVPPDQRPLVFVEPLAGRAGADGCCNTQGDVGWGQLVSAIGARNLGKELLGGKHSGEVTLETVIERKPDVYVMTGTGRNRPGSTMAPMGYEAEAAHAEKAFQALEHRPGFSALKAAEDGRVFGIWHNFYNHNYNLVALEYLAKFAYPQRFADLDPAATWHEIITRFTHLPDVPVLLAVKAPAANASQ